LWLAPQVATSRIWNLKFGAQKSEQDLNHFAAPLKVKSIFLKGPVEMLRQKLAQLCLGKLVIPVCRCSILAALGVANNVGAAESVLEDKLVGNISLTSNYVWRGLSQTFDGPALQAGAEFEHRSGLYVGAWASNVSEKWVPGSNLESNLYTGYRFGFDDLNVDLGAIYVYYPQGDYSKALGGNVFLSSRPNTAEASLALSYKWLSMKYGRTLTPFYGWTPDNSAPGIFSSVDPKAGVIGSTSGSQFGELGLKKDLDGGWGLSAIAGRQWIANSVNLDWSYFRVGVNKSISAGWGAGIFYSWTTNPRAFQSYASLTGNGQTANIAAPKVFLSITRDF
jgi:uncharacterized protein (TIGR02001 family)